MDELELKELTVWGAVKSNMYWGRRSGMVYYDKSHAFKAKKWSNGSNNSGASGWKLRRERRGRI